MKGRKGWMDRLTEGMDMAEEALPRHPLVEICGERRVLIENHLGVRSYGHEQICVGVSYGEVAVHGCSLELARMTREQLVICGRIDGVRIIRRNGR